MNKYLIYSLLFLVVASKPASSQDLNSLKARASQLWTLRQQANKSKAADFIEKEARSNFAMYENVREASVTALEFTQDKSRIRVTTRAKVFVPTIGTVQQTITESWVWKGGNWFVHVEPATNPFEVAGARSAVTVHQGFTFQLVDKKIDLGVHKQGDTIKGTVKFASPRSMLQVIRSRGFDGFRIGATRWIDDKNGEVDFSIDSSLIAQDIEANVVLEGVGPERVFEVTTVAENLTLVGRVEGRIRISQLPQTPEAEKGKFVELEIKNVGNASFRVEQVRPLDSSFVVGESEMPLPLASGNTARIAVSYPTQAGLVDGELMIHLSEGVLPSNSALFRIKGVVTLRAAQRPAPPTRSTSDFEEAIRKALQDAQRAGVPTQ